MRHLGEPLAQEVDRRAAKPATLPASKPVWETAVTEVVLINPFVVPAALRDEYLATYHAVMERLSQQPGFLGGGLHRAVNPDGVRFQFINVNRWASAEAFHAGIAAVNPTEIFGDLAQRIEANPALFTVETSYPPSGA